MSRLWWWTGAREVDEAICIASGCFWSVSRNEWDEKKQRYLVRDVKARARKHCREQGHKVKVPYRSYLIYEPGIRE